MVQEEICRKGPWTENEDVQLGFYVNLFGERRWDFIAKVSGLKRTGKSCRLRWVNYLHPDLKRSKMTANEERLVLELHSKWGNRWSRIARKLPGRTDNEIKNYWRTYMRKKTREKKKEKTSSVSLSSSSSSSSSSSICHTRDSTMEMKERSFYDTGGKKITAAQQVTEKGYSMDEIWNDIALSDDEFSIKPICNGYGDVVFDFYSPILASPIWDYNPESLWMSDEEDSKIFFSESDEHTFPFNG